MIKVYGSYELAASNTPLIASMLERHLYDIIPKAWAALGNKVIPPPINDNNPMAKAAKISRRHSIASRSPQTPTISPSPINSTTARIGMRRMSTVNQHNDSDNSVDDGSSRSKINIRRQSIQVDVMKTMAQNAWADISVPRSGWL